MMIFGAVFLLTALINQVSGVPGFLAISNAAATVVIAGTSVASSANAASSSGASVSSRIEIENWTRFSLSLPAYTHPRGIVRTPPGNVLPGRREAMFTEKPGGSYGTWGTVSWLASGLNRRVVLMWSVPFSNSYYFWFGAGTSDRGVTEHDNEWLYDMYSSTGYRNYPVRQRGSPTSTERSTYTAGMTYVKKSIGYNSWSIQYQDDDIEIRVSNGNGYNLESKVLVVPRREEDLAQAIKEQMQQ